MATAATPFYDLDTSRSASTRTSPTTRAEGPPGFRTTGRPDDAAAGPVAQPVAAAGPARQVLPRPYRAVAV